MDDTDRQITAIVYPSESHRRSGTLRKDVDARRLLDANSGLLMIGQGPGADGEGRHLSTTFFTAVGTAASVHLPSQTHGGGRLGKNRRRPPPKTLVKSQLEDENQ